jgi:hypothetical protein
LRISLAKPAGRNGHPATDREAALGYRYHARGLPSIFCSLFVLRQNVIPVLSCPGRIRSSFSLGKPVMCGRVRLSSDVSEIKLAFSIPPHRPTRNFPPSWHLAPTDPLPVVRYDAKGGEGSQDLLR